MSPHDFSTGLCRGRDTLPLHPIPRNQTMAVYTEELTHLLFAFPTSSVPFNPRNSPFNPEIRPFNAF